MKHPIKNSLLLLCLFLSLRCEPVSENIDTSEAPSYKAIDTHSHARPLEAVTKHLDLQLSIDFNKKILAGFARFQIEQQNALEIILDSKGLDIEKVTIGTEEKEVSFELSSPDPILGSALSIPLEENTKVVTVYYQTTPKGAAAVDWLEPQQTADKKHPFLFTQGQAILTRTWIPCQDSPGIRITYNASIQVPKGLMAVMSATNPQEINEAGIYSFKMEQPIPAYLIALAAGDIRFAPIGPRTGIYAEASVIDAAVYEFADMERMLEVAEDLYGPYLWERYDLIVLPPSFPFGGMENPRLTFATPTVIAGDRSLTSLIAHELAHSWSGNLVTNATWNDFWLNEGFTTYFERRIMEALYGESYANMLAQLGYQDLVHSIPDLAPEDTHLQLQLEGRDPDDGMTDIAYEKGAHFLKLLENTAGREQFDTFLKTYFQEYQFQTITTEAFEDYLKTDLLEKYDLDINTKEWIHGPGIPDNIPIANSNRFSQVDESIARLENGKLPGNQDTEAWSTHEWLHFIRHLPPKLDMPQLADLDQTFQWTQSGNSEILAAWFEYAVRNNYLKQVQPQMEEFLTTVGRRKFLTPLYRALKESGELETAQSIFEQAAPNYHSVSRGSIEQLLYQ